MEAARELRNIQPVKCLCSFSSLTLTGFSAAAAVTLLFAPSQPDLMANPEPPPNRRAKFQSHTVHVGPQTARELIGHRVEAPTGDFIGRVNDVVIDPRTGEAMFVVLSSGGFAGVGAKLRAVPPRALSQSRAKRGVLFIDVEPKRWKTAPRMDKERLAKLQDPAVARRIYAFYHQHWPGEANESQPRLKFATELMGESVLNPQRGEIGRVSDLMVDLRNPRATRAIVVPTEMQNARFLIPLNDFGNAPAGNVLFLNTDLRVFQMDERAESGGGYKRGTAREA